MSQLAPYCSLCLTCTHYCSAKFLCVTNSHSSFSCEKAHCWWNAWTEVFKMPKRLKVSSCSSGSWTQGNKLWVRGVQQANLTAAWCSGPTSQETNQDQVLDHPTALRNHHVLVFLPPCMTPLPESSFHCVCRMVVFLNPVLTKASTGGTHEAELAMAHGWSQGLSVQQDKLREINLTPGRHQEEREPRVDMSNNLLFRRGL